jgi:RNA polymerase sigma factor (sigma-70 family)
MALRTRRYEDFSDDELHRAFLNGDSDSFGELFRRHNRAIFLECYRLYNDGAQAQDAVQETFLRAFQNPDKFREGNYLAWLRRIARHVFIDQWRRKRPETPIAASDEEAAVVLISPVPSPEVDASLEQLHREMAKLPVEQRKCLELQIEGYSYEEIATRTGLSAPAVRSHIQNGRRTLKLRLGTVAI